MKLYGSDRTEKTEGSLITCVCWNNEDPTQLWCGRIRYFFHANLSPLYHPKHRATEQVFAVVTWQRCDPPSAHETFARHVVMDATEEYSMYESLVPVENIKEVFVSIPTWEIYKTEAEQKELYVESYFAVDWFQRR